MLPYPNDWFTRPDPTSATGRRLNLPALGMPGTIAISEPTPLLEIAESTRTDAGTLVLAPCFADCPQPGR